MQSVCTITAYINVDDHSPLKEVEDTKSFLRILLLSLYWDSTYQDMATRPYNNKWWKNVLVLGCLCWSDEDLEAEKEMLISSNVSDKRHHWIFNLKAKLCSWELLIIYYRQGKALIRCHMFLVRRLPFLRQDCIRPIQKQHIFQSCGRLWPFPGESCLLNNVSKNTEVHKVSVSANEAHKKEKTVSSVLS